MIPGRFDGKVALVTGSAAGIGKVTAQRFAAEGAKVVVADIDEAGAATVARGIEDAGGVAVAQKVDVSKEHEVQSVVRRALDEWGRLDVVHNNAFWMGPFAEDQQCLIADIDSAAFVRRLEINLLGVFYGIKHAIPPMLEAGSGAIINMSTGAATRGHTTGSAAYGATKAAVESLTRSTAVHYGKRGIRCNAIAPGSTATDSLADLSDEQIRILGNATTSPTALATPEEQAAVITFLASDDASRINGHTIQTGAGQDIIHISTAVMTAAGADKRQG